MNADGPIIGSIIERQCDFYYIPCGISTGVVRHCDLFTSARVKTKTKKYRRAEIRSDETIFVFLASVSNNETIKPLRADSKRNGKPLCLHEARDFFC